MILTENLTLVMKSPSLFSLSPAKHQSDKMRKMNNFLDWYQNHIKSNLAINNDQFERILNKM